MTRNHVFVPRIMMVFELWRLSKLCNKVTIFFATGEYAMRQSIWTAGCGKVHARQKSMNNFFSLNRDRICGEDIFCSGQMRRNREGDSGGIRKNAYAATGLCAGCVQRTMRSERAPGPETDGNAAPAFRRGAPCFSPASFGAVLSVVITRVRMVAAVVITRVWAVTAVVMAWSRTPAPVVPVVPAAIPVPVAMASVVPVVIKHRAVWPVVRSWRSARRPAAGMMLVPGRFARTPVVLFMRFSRMPAAGARYKLGRRRVRRVFGGKDRERRAGRFRFRRRIHMTV